jgi:hypothetical protein
MEIEMTKFEEYKGWEIVFEVELTAEEFETCDIGPLKHLGHYEISKKEDNISIIFNFTEKELKAGEAMDERVELIKKDIDDMVTTCKD